MRKFNIENQIHFITIDVYKKMKIFREDNLCQIVINNLKFYRKKFSFKLFGYVIMLNHVHLLLQLSEKYHDVSKVMQFFKGHSAREIVDYLKANNLQRLSFFRVLPEPLLGQSQGRSRGSDLPGDNRLVSKRKGKRSVYQIWMSDFYDFNIYSEKKLEEKLNYIHNNLVKADFCKNPNDWKWSSYRNYEFNDSSLLRIDSIS